MRSQAFSSPSKRGLVGVVVAGLVAALCLLLIPGAPDAAKGQSEPTANAAKKKKKKKKDTVKVMTQNLYLGADLGPPVQAAVGPPPRTDLFADRVGTVLKNVNANDFAVRARTIASGIKKHKVDVVGLQEAALWKLEIPTDGGGPPRGSAATVPLIDYQDTLLNELNKKAKNKKQCAKAAKKRKAQGKKPKPCYRGYYLVGFQEEADVEQFGDFDNDPGPDGKTCDLSSGTCPPPPGSDSWTWGNDDTPGVNIGEPPSPPFPPDANFDQTPFNGGGDDPPAGPGGTDCPDTNPGASPVPPFPAAFGGDIDPNTAGSQVPVCMFHGIDGDIRLQMRDAIIARKGAGVKALSVYGANFGNTFSVSAFGVPIQFKRGFIVADMSVRGKKFHLVNTHLESEDAGTIREDQALELVNPGGPAAAKKTVLVGDLNSDPASADPESPPAYNALAAAGFRSLTGPGLTSGHGELLSDLGNVLDNSRIDHILTNDPSITMRSSLVLDPVGGGLWASDHGGVLSRLAIPGGKKKGKKK
ncbi:MAG TPA: endonuclease/exonuclease/phosphatase family protein [Solirubrobacterales bacterium]